MKGAILGFQRCWRWPKWAPDSSSWRMENSGKAIVQSPLPVGQTRGLSLEEQRHRTATAEYPQIATRACEMARLIRIWRGHRKRLVADSEPKKAGFQPKAASLPACAPCRKGQESDRLARPWPGRQPRHPGPEAGLGDDSGRTAAYSAPDRSRTNAKHRGDRRSPPVA